MRSTVLVVSAALGGALVATKNMNVGSKYMFDNPNPAAPRQFDTDFASRPASTKYFELYAGPIETRYGEVFWSGLPKVPLPPDVIARYAGKTIAIVGYEEDQVVKAEDAGTDEDVPVPITAVYNHHYVAWLKGANAEMIELDEDNADTSIAGHPLKMHAYALNDPNPSSLIPTSQFFSEGNGGESRKSYHGYPPGMAQLLDSPEYFIMTPMNIDTWNRNRTFNQSFVPSIEPKASAAPMTGPDAVYSGHLECPCTDRIVKSSVHTYTTQLTGTCAAVVADAQSCFDGAATVGVAASAALAASVRAPMSEACSTLNVNITGEQCSGMLPVKSAQSAAACRAACCAAGRAACGHWLYDASMGCFNKPGTCVPMSAPTQHDWVGEQHGPAVFTNRTVSSGALPIGCSLVNSNGSTTVYFNTEAASKAACGAGSSGALAGSATSVVTFALKLDPTVKGGEATLTLTGPADVWFGVGLGSQAMADTPNAIIVLGNGTVFEQKLANQQAGSRLATSVAVRSVNVAGGQRTVVLTRPFAGKTAAHYTFDVAHASLDFINAVGKGADFAYHANKASATLSLAAVGDAATCVCDAGHKDYIASDMNPTPQLFSKNCEPEPMGDLLRQKNPTCWLDTYRGGLKCCKSGNILLDKHQNPWEKNILKYYMKWRFYYEDFVNVTEAAGNTSLARGEGVEAAAPAASTPSHQNLVRFFHDGGGAGEYDVVKAPAGTSPQDTIYQITTHLQVKNGVAQCDARYSPHCAGPMQDGITLVYASGHCHAPSCIKMELWNADTGALICRQTPHYGGSAAATAAEPYDEKGYVAIPPCLFGNFADGLYPPHYLSYDTNLTFVKWNNNTYDHYGEMVCVCAVRAAAKLGCLLVEHPIAPHVPCIELTRRLAISVSVSVSVMTCRTCGRCAATRAGTRTRRQLSSKLATTSIPSCTFSDHVGPRFAYLKARWEEKERAQNVRVWRALATFSESVSAYLSLS